MSHQSENNKKLNDFFSEEYHSLKRYVGSRLKASIDRDPEDIIQDVALKLFTGADRYSPINNVAGFVYRAIRNKIIDVMRKGSSKQHKEHEVASSFVSLAELIYENEDLEYSNAMKDTLKKAIAELKPEYQHIIIAIDFENYSYKEVAQHTGIPLGTLMSRRHRAISLLYKTLKPKKDSIN
ncbi:hypothetical protein MHTCC0001_06220 [Flavobacteriaceae bacterium MHTCC 0001]